MNVKGGTCALGDVGVVCVLCRGTGGTENLNDPSRDISQLGMFALTRQLARLSFSLNEIVRKRYDSYSTASSSRIRTIGDGNYSMSRMAPRTFSTKTDNSH